MSKKKIRSLIFQKYNGKCAYCGTDLIKGWHIDHIHPRIMKGTDEISNLNPSCKECNNYKCHSSLELFRTYLKQMLNDKMQYLFKSKTKMKIAENMGTITIKKWDGIFYFEKITLTN